MARIKIKDLPKGSKITKDEMKKVFGGNIANVSPMERKGFAPQPEPPKTAWQTTLIS